MTLLELLVKELPKRDGWPSRAYLAKSYSHIPDVCFWDGDGVTVPYYSISNRPIGDGAVTRDQYEAALASSQQPVWDGEGLPPVGCECEAMISNPSSAGHAWRKVKVVHIGEPGSKCEALVFDVETTYPSWADELRPLRSEADKKRDAVIEFITSAIDSHGVDPLNSAKFIYDAIAAGKIPGVKLED